MKTSHPLLSPQPASPEPYGFWEPIVELQNQCPVGGEILCRGPQPIGHAAWQQWYATIGTQAATLPPDLGWVSVNLDSDQILDTRLVTTLIASMREAPHIPWRLEWTERGRGRDIVPAAHAFCRLRDRYGLPIVIDDVGAGRDGLQRIALTEPQGIKIDRHLLRRAHHHASARHIITHLVSLADSLQAQVILEGIETDDDHQLAQALEIHLGQGYLWPGYRITAFEGVYSASLEQQTGI